ncbi:MAG: XAC2610-related protein [Lawsonibacter sp.]|jgi:hypothetical protein
MRFFPRSPFTTRLSRSGNETQLRIAGILQGKKKSLPLWLRGLILLFILCGGSLVSFQIQAVNSPQHSSSSPSLRILGLEMDGPHFPHTQQTQLELPDGGRLFFQTNGPTEEATSADCSSTLYYSNDHSSFVDYPLTTIPYNPEHPQWANVSVSLCGNVLGYESFLLAYPTVSTGTTLEYYGLLEDVPPYQLAACQDNAWRFDMDEDGQDELLSNYHYHTDGYLEVYWQDGFFPRSLSLNDTARSLLGLPSNLWVSLNGLASPGEDSVIAHWTHNGQEYTQELALTQLWKWEQQRTDFTDTCFLTTASGRILQVILEEKKLEGPYMDHYFQVERILVYEGDTLLQGLDAASFSCPGFKDWEGLFVNRGYSVGEPTMLDLNFDGSQDLGLLATSSYSQNVPYAFFLWDDQQEELVPSIQLSAFPNLDEEAREVIDYTKQSGYQFQWDYYSVNLTGELELTRREIVDYSISDAPSGHYWVDTYSVQQGELIYTGRVAKPF